MSKIGHGYGSEWHLLRFLGYHRDILTTEIALACGANSAKVMDFGFAPNAKILFDDVEAKRVDFISIPEVQAGWKKYWPATGTPPTWDAVGNLEYAHGTELMMIEAKAHVGELNSSCGAKNPASLRTIKSAFASTAKVLTNGGNVTPAWMDEYYQLANRLAVLNFLTNVCQPPVPARLVLVYFYGQRGGNMNGRNCPQDQVQWKNVLSTMYKALDIDERSTLWKRVHNVFVDAHPKH